MYRTGEDGPERTASLLVAATRIDEQVYIIPTGQMTRRQRGTPEQSTTRRHPSPPLFEPSTIPSWSFAGYQHESLYGLSPFPLITSTSFPFHCGAGCLPCFVIVLRLSLHDERIKGNLSFAVFFHGRSPCATVEAGKKRLRQANDLHLVLLQTSSLFLSFSPFHPNMCAEDVVPFVRIRRTDLCTPPSPFVDFIWRNTHLAQTRKKKKRKGKRRTIVLTNKELLYLSLSIRTRSTTRPSF